MKCYIRYIGYNYMYCYDSWGYYHLNIKNNPIIISKIKTYSLKECRIATRLLKIQQHNTNPSFMNYLKIKGNNARRNYN